MEGRGWHLGRCVWGRKVLALRGGDESQVSEALILGTKFQEKPKKLSSQEKQYHSAVFPLNKTECKMNSMMKNIATFEINASCSSALSASLASP